MSGWLNLVSSLLIMAGAGSAILFPQYSDLLKNKFEFDQRALALISTAKDAATNMSVLSDVLSSVAPSWLILLIGALLNLGGSLILWTALTSKIKRLQLWETSATVFIATWGLNLGEQLVLTKTFEEGSIQVGWPILEGVLILGGAIQSHYLESSSVLLLFNATVPSIFFLASTFGIKEKNQNTNFLKRLGKVSCGVATILLICTTIKVFFPISPILELCMLVFFTVVFFIATGNGQEGDSTCSRMDTIENPEVAELISVKQELCSKNMQLLILVAICGLGSTSTFSNNLSQIYSSLGYDLDRTSSFITIGVLFKFFGKMLSGYISHTTKIPPPIILTFTLLLGSLGSLCVVFHFDGAVYIASILISLSSGSLPRQLILMMQDLYGTKQYLILYGFLNMFLPLGTVILSLGVTATIYDLEASSQVQSELKNVVTTSTCIGEGCFRTSFEIIAFVQFVAALISMVLIKRTWIFYQGHF